MDRRIEVFEIGDVVILKSGGPGMTVMGYGISSNENEIFCLWFDFDANGNLIPGLPHENMFDAGTIVKLPPKSAGD